MLHMLYQNVSKIMSSSHGRRINKMVISVWTICQQFAKQHILNQYIVTCLLASSNRKSKQDLSLRAVVLHSCDTISKIALLTSVSSCIKRSGIVNVVTYVLLQIEDHSKQRGTLRHQQCEKALLRIAQLRLNTR